MVGESAGIRISIGIRGVSPLLAFASLCIIPKQLTRLADAATDGSQVQTFPIAASA
jgi:hypothetical protein